MEEQLREDGLTIMAAGLAWQRIAGVLVQVQMERRRCWRTLFFFLIGMHWRVQDATHDLHAPDYTCPPGHS